MTYEEKIQSAARLHTYVTNWRGRLINSVSVIDLQLALVISKFFGKEIAAIQSKTFSKKREMLRVIFQQDPLLETDKDRNLINELKAIGSFRNILAHSVLDVSYEALAKSPKDGVGFISYKGGQKKINSVTEADFNDWNGRIGTVASLIGDTMRIMNIDSSLIS
jgi:hypothetical protein